FPIISLLSALPVTVAGSGVREGASLVLLGLYGVSKEDAVAAAFLTLSVSLTWALAGALLLWRESNWQRRQRHPAANTISVIIPTLNEREALPETARRARAVPEVSEIIVVDGGSSDGTP